jgi:signal transduction histidine kinase
MPSEVSMSGADQGREPTVEDLERELAEAHRREAVTGEILKVISRSAFDLQGVLDSLVESAAKLCEAEIANIWRPAGAAYRLAASYGVASLSKDWLAHREYLRGVAYEPGRGSCVGRTLLEGRVVQIDDVQADREYDQRAAVGNVRTTLGVPLLRAGNVIGVMILVRATVRPFATKQIQLIETFADQAVIAIENTRLFEEVQARTKELQQSLDRQTATSEVLGVISRSPNEVQPVLDTIVATAQRLCQAERAAIWRLEGGTFRAVAHRGQPEERVEPILRARMPLGGGSMVGRATLARRAVQVEDVATDPELVATHAFSRAGNIHTVLAVPLLLKSEPIGVITLSRTRVAPFDEKEIALVESFADQAVIAIENTRLFEAERASKHELTEALEQQTATADVLKVISRSALDLQKVLDALVESAARLCNADDALIFQVFGDGLRLVAHHGQIPTARPVGQLTRPLVRGFIIGRAVIDGRTIQVADALAEADEYPESHKNALQLGYRTQLAVPLLHAGEAIGVIVIRRAEVRPFTERQIELVNTFGDQAVIAIENTRLFEEVQARTRELAKTVEDLEIASQHKNQFVANMSHELRTPLAAILGYAELIQEGFYGALPEKSLDALTRIRSNGKHLLGLINTVLDIAKIESGQFTLNMSEYAIESVVETVRAATESLAQNKKLTLTTSVDKALPVGLGDEQRLTQVLLNLVGNAIKFTDAGEVSIAASARNGRFAVLVTDTGPGIPLDQQDRIFDQFHQVDNSLTKAKGGTGLGLAIAKQIVEMHGGRIWVVSTPGKGSTFQMELPTRAPVASARSH